ncbi:MAG: segregation/condensation protein A [bacterium]|nr:segregation/condensation protein A [bacterium]
MSYQNYGIKLEFFSGPLDLLLHLVQQKEVAVEDVEMADICEQYLSVINSTTNLDLERASEFLVVAAVLIQIKSRQLLSEGATIDESIPESHDDSFYEELRERLKRYEMNRRRAELLAAMPQEGIDTFVRETEKAEVEDPEELEFNLDSLSLGKMFYSLLKRVGETARTYRVRMESVSIVDFMMRTLDFLGERLNLAAGKASNGLALVGSGSGFRELVQNFAFQVNKTSPGRLNSAGERRAVVIGSFIGLLELVKRGAVNVESENLDADDFVIEPAFVIPGENLIADDGEELGSEGRKQENIIDFAKYLPRGEDTVGLSGISLGERKEREAGAGGY